MSAFGAGKTCPPSQEGMEGPRIWAAPGRLGGSTFIHQLLGLYFYKGLWGQRQPTRPGGGVRGPGGAGGPQRRGVVGLLHVGRASIFLGWPPT